MTREPRYTTAIFPTELNTTTDTHSVSCRTFRLQSACEIGFGSRK